MLLALDTALGETSLALLASPPLTADEAPQIVAHAHYAELKQQSSMLVVWIEQLLAPYGGFSALERITCGHGPGGFTSLRVGLSTARMLAFAAKIPIHGYSTLQIMAYAHQENHAQCCILPAGKGLWYVQYFNHAEPASPPQVCRTEQCTLAPEVPLITTRADILPGHTRRIDYIPALHAHYLGKYATQYPLTDAQAKASAAPLYIRAPDAEIAPALFG